MLKSYVGVLLYFGSLLEMSLSINTGQYIKLEYTHNIIHTCTVLNDHGYSDTLAGIKYVNALYYTIIVA